MFWPLMSINIIRIFLEHPRVSFDGSLMSACKLGHLAAELYSNSV